MSYLVEGVVASLDAPTTLAFLLGLLSFRWWILGPSSLVFLALGQDFSVGALLLGIGLSLYDQMERNQGPWWKNRPEPRQAQVLFLLSLLGLSLFWRAEGLQVWAMFFLPWVWYRPIESWMGKNSGGGSLWIPLLLVSALLSVFPTQAGSTLFLEASVGSFLLLVAWYRKIPLGLKLISLILGCSFWLNLSFQRLDLFCVLLGMALFQALESYERKKPSCRQTPWSLYMGLAWVILLLMAPPQLGWLPMALLIVSTFLLSQEICRLCLISTRCRERVFSTMASRIPFLFGLIWAFEGVAPLDFVWLILFALGADATRKTQLRPVTESAIGQSYCRSGWEKTIGGN